jgi:hypothetical protein
MEKNMSGIQPRTLTNDELIRFCEQYIDLASDNIPIPKGMPLEWQKELLKRFTQADVQHAPAYPQHGQLDLFK